MYLLQTSYQVCMCRRIGISAGRRKVCLMSYVYVLLKVQKEKTEARCEGRLLQNDGHSAGATPIFGSKMWILKEMLMRRTNYDT